MDELKSMIEETLVSCLSVDELCEAYAEIYSHAKEQMKLCAKCLLQEVEEDGKQVL